MTNGAEAEVIPLPLLAQRLPGLPDAGLDAVLDATVECVARYGLAKTSLSDIAREMGVAPSTVYRKVGTVENAVRLVMAREGHRQLARMPEVIAGVKGPRVITVFLAATITAAASHPMVAKILHDERDWMGRLATRTLDERLAGGPRSRRRSWPRRWMPASSAGRTRSLSPTGSCGSRRSASCRPRRATCARRSTSCSCRC